ncbi:MAG: hypothetical protein VX130_05470 [Verrucomicrobiota bacterium]|nr:hypothetical protein [Verrucomicrobiota bacterium]
MRLTVSLVDHNGLAKPIRFMCFFVSFTSLSFFIVASAKAEERTDKIDPITKKNDERSIEVSSYTPKIQILSKDWGNGHPDDIKKVLESTASVLFRYGVQVPNPSILVGQSANGPIVLHQRGDKGEYLINLNTKDRYWCQYAFQFSHELGHILCGFKKGDSSNMWFEESLCEVASLFSLLQLQLLWREKPPYPNWISYAPEFKKYVEQRISQNQKFEIKDLSIWFANNELYLRKNPTDRKKNLAVACKLLPLLEEQPENWSACAYLNKQKSNEFKTFPQYLDDWRNACKYEAQIKFVENISSKFGILLPLNATKSNDRSF